MGWSCLGGTPHFCMIDQDPVILPSGRTPGGQGMDLSERVFTLDPTLAAGGPACGRMTGLTQDPTLAAGGPASRQDDRGFVLFIKPRLLWGTRLRG